MDKKAYTVTEAGGPRPDIANKLRMPGDVVHLTDKQAEWELRRGTIVPKGQDKEAPKSRKAKG